MKGEGSRCGSLIAGSGGMSRAVGAIAAAAAAGIGAYALFRGEEQRSQDFRAVDGALGGVLGGVLSKAGLGGKQQGELRVSLCSSAGEMVLDCSVSVLRACGRAPLPPLRACIVVPPRARQWR